METKLDQENRQLKIKDNFKVTLWCVKFVMTVNVIQMITSIIKVSISEWDTLSCLEFHKLTTESKKLDSEMNLE